MGAGLERGVRVLPLLAGRPSRCPGCQGSRQTGVRLCGRTAGLLSSGHRLCRRGVDRMFHAGNGREGPVGLPTLGLDYPFKRPTRGPRAGV